MQEISADLDHLIAAVNRHFARSLWLDCQVEEFRQAGTASKLRIVGSFDASYYHNVEIELIGTEFFQGAFCWTCSPDETGLIQRLDPRRSQRLIARNRLDGPQALLQFPNDDGKAVIASCHSLGFNTDTVFYYWRENLQPGERIAAWVKPPGG